MKITSFILCDSARLRPDGSFDVVNGGFSETRRAAYPARLSLCAVLVLEAEPDEYGPQSVEVSLRDANGRKLQLWPYPFELAPGQKGASLVLNLKGVRLPSAGEFQFDVRLNGKVIGPAKTIRAAISQEVDR